MDATIIDLLVTTGHEIDAGKHPVQEHQHHRDARDQRKDNQARHRRECTDGHFNARDCNFQASNH